jgi:uncharacterized protein (TIGR03000 family)
VRSSPAPRGNSNWDGRNWEGNRDWDGNRNWGGDWDDWGRRGWWGGWGYPFYRSWYWPYYYGGNYGPYVYNYGPDYYDNGYNNEEPYDNYGYDNGQPSGYTSFYQPNGNRAELIVRVPANAELWLNDQRMQQTGRVREFDTPPLDPSGDYHYNIRASWAENGKSMESDRNVVVHAGDRLNIDMLRQDTGLEPAGRMDRDRMNDRDRMRPRPPAPDRGSPEPKPPTP